MKHKQLKWKPSAFMTAFLILAFIFLVLGLGTLGSGQSVGRSYRLAKQRTSAQAPSILISLTDPGHGDEGHVHKNLYVTDVYINVGTIYTPYGQNATLRLAKGNNAEASFYYTFDLELINLYQGVESEVVEGDHLYNWIKFDLDDNTWALSNNSCWKLTAINADVLINEIVFVGNESDRSGKPVVLEATIDTKSNLPETDGLKLASAVIDRQKIPSLSQSSFFRYGQEEIAALSTITEMKQGAVYDLADNVYHMDMINGSFGLDLLALGTTIFGLSPFGLRIMPFLASFGILVFGFLLIRRMTGSEKAGFVFALVYALCGLSMSLGHFGAPITIAAFFLVASFYFIYRYFAEGMKRASYSSALPVLLGALFAGAAVCVNGVCLIPVLGIVAFFVAGFVRQLRLQKAELDLLIERAEAEERAQVLEERAQVSEEGAPENAGKQAVVKALNENRFKNAVAPSIFGSFLVFGGLLIAMISALPLFNVFTKVYDPEHSRSIFYFFLRAFAGGFVGNNGLSDPQSAFAPLYQLFRGTGSVYAVTAAGLLPALAAILAGVVGAVFAILRLKSAEGETFREALIKTVLLLCGFVISLVAAFFAKAGLGLVLLAEIFLFLLAGYSSKDVFEEKKSLGRTVVWILGALLVAAFVIFAIVTFSIPLPASFMTRIFG